MSKLFNDPGNQDQIMATGGKDGRELTRKDPEVLETDDFVGDVKVEKIVKDKALLRSKMFLRVVIETILVFLFSHIFNDIFSRIFALIILFIGI